MIDPHDTLADELRRIRPGEPPLRLGEAIGRELAPPGAAAPARPALPRSVKISLWTSWSLTALAACLAFAFGLRQPAAAGRLTSAPTGAPGGESPPTVPAVSADPAPLQPVSSRGYLFSARDEGLVMLEDGLPARQVRYQFIDTLQLRRPGDHASVSVSYPREEIRLVPVRTY